MSEVECGLRGGKSGVHRLRYNKSEKPGKKSLDGASKLEAGDMTPA